MITGKNKRLKNLTGLQQSYSLTNNYISVMQLVLNEIFPYGNKALLKAI